jgi:predicted DNA binding CopG/RHH family protein
MPAALPHAIKREANRRAVPYQSLIKVVLAGRFAVAKS